MDLDVTPFLFRHIYRVITDGIVAQALPVTLTGISAFVVG
ncbi:hypothetical protein VTH8203_03953 [Vibrio thalassae]|uniref:Uncharacterized protein n=1 Tax=Vibrio thalassae TaxID=1243014 RepID=A0A240ENR7_9VIBR|nr:hypothetical protein VTH8203_03953 [Vibrio thalassae]